VTRRIPKKRSFHVGKLNTVQDVAAERTKLYRRTVHGSVDSSDAARHSSILAELRKDMEQGIIETRLLVIEDAILRLAATRGAPILLKGESHGGPETET
jgi:hypothetical protein